MDEKRLAESLANADGMLSFIGSFGYSLWQKAEKNAKNIKGLKGWIVGLVLVSGYALYELAERKRSQNYLDDRIRKLEEYTEKIEKVESDMAETINNDICPRLDKIDGGACDA